MGWSTIAAKNVRGLVSMKKMIYDSSCLFFFFSSRRRHTRFDCDWSSDVCSSDLALMELPMSIGYSRLPFGVWGSVYRLLTARPLHSLHLLGIASRLGLITRILQIGRASCRERV